MVCVCCVCVSVVCVSVVCVCCVCLSGVCVLCVSQLWWSSVELRKRLHLSSEKVMECVCLSGEGV